MYHWLPGLSWMLAGWRDPGKSQGGLGGFTMQFGELTERPKPLGEKPGIDGAELRDASACGPNNSPPRPEDFRFSTAESMAI